MPFQSNYHNLFNALYLLGHTPDLEDCQNIEKAFKEDKIYKQILFGSDQKDQLRDRDIALKLALLNCEVYPDNDTLNMVKEAIIKDKAAV